MDEEAVEPDGLPTSRPSNDKRFSVVVDFNDHLEGYFLLLTTGLKPDNESIAEGSKF